MEITVVIVIAIVLVIIMVIVVSTPLLGTTGPVASMEIASMDRAVLAGGGGVERRVLTAFHSGFKLILNPAASLEHVMGSCL